MKKVIESVKCSKQVNVSSTGHYTFSVLINWFDKRRLVTTYYHGADEYGYFKRPPKYLLKMTYLACLELVQSGNAQFYENTRDGGERYEDLRYHDIDQLLKELELFVKQSQEKK